MATAFIPLLLLLFLSLTVTSISIQPRSDTSPPYIENLSESVQMTIRKAQEVVSFMSMLVGIVPNFRIHNALFDCMDLLGLTIQELNWTLTSTVKINSETNGKQTEEHKANLNAWLSAAFTNQDTCLDGFQGTNETVKVLFVDGLEEVTALIGNVLKMVDQIPVGNHNLGGRKLLERNYPAWIQATDQEILEFPIEVIRFDVTVANDGSGNFTSVMDAVEAAPENSNRRYAIYVKRGVYIENVEIKKNKMNVVLIGDGIDATVISGNRSFKDGWTTYRSATFAVSGSGFIARGITFENSAGPEKQQAVAFRSSSDFSVYYHCAFQGYQDTLYPHTLRQFYRECRISGTIDFIFGNGAVVFQNCHIIARKPLPNQKNTVTAQGRKGAYQNTGFSIQHSIISADIDVLESLNTTETYLGRPWKPYSTTIIMESYLGGAINPKGWLEWDGDYGLNTLFYGEYKNLGPGAGLSGRVNWTGFHEITNPTQLLNFTVAQLINGNQWLPSTGIQYTAGLTL